MGESLSWFVRVVGSSKVRENLTVRMGCRLFVVVVVFI